MVMIITREYSPLMKENIFMGYKKLTKKHLKIS